MAAEPLKSRVVVEGFPGGPGGRKPGPRLSANDTYMQVRSLFLGGFAALIGEENWGVDRMQQSLVESSWCLSG